MPSFVSNVGRIVSVWRYPVKSMQGEELNASDVTETGLLGDRTYALIDAADGKVVSAKNPKKWPGLFDYRAAYVEPPRLGAPAPPVRITLPDGQIVRSDEPSVDDILSERIGRKVRLGRTAPKAGILEEYWPSVEGLAHQEHVSNEALPAETFFDCAVVHVLTTATLNRLRGLYPEGRFEVRRFRPNFVVEVYASAADFVENGWIGGTLAIGTELQLTVTGPCPRCVMTTLPQSDLTQDLGILRTVAQHNGAHVGIYAAVSRPGRVIRGVGVALEQATIAQQGG